jgi:hypothetical protein
VKTNYQKALDFMQRAEFADTPELAELYLRRSAIYAQLAMVDALHEGR